MAGDLAGGALRHRRRRHRQLALPAHLTNVSSLSRFGSTLGFVLIALLWFYLLALGILAGAVINSLRFELQETGEMPYTQLRNPCAGPDAGERPRLTGKAAARQD